MLLSIIIPVYNLEDYVATTVDSILMQTYPNIEIIIVDDGSSDRSGAICDGYANRHNSITVIHQENRGLSAARNAGIKVAKGDYITFIDADDTYGTDDTIELSMQLLATDPKLDFIQFPLIHVKMGKQVKLKPCQQKDIIISDKQEYLKYRLQYLISNNVCNKIYRADIFQKILFSEGALCEDAIFNTMNISLINRCMITNRGYYRYNTRENSIMTGKKDISFYHDFLFYKELLYKSSSRYKALGLYIAYNAALLALLYIELSPKMFITLAPRIKAVLPKMSTLNGISSYKEIRPKVAFRLTVFLILKLNFLFVKKGRCQRNQE